MRCAKLFICVILQVTAYCVLTLMKSLAASFVL